MGATSKTGGAHVEVHVASYGRCGSGGSMGGPR